MIVHMDKETQITWTLEDAEEAAAANWDPAIEPGFVDAWFPSPDVEESAAMECRQIWAEDMHQRAQALGQSDHGLTAEEFAEEIVRGEVSPETQSKITAATRAKIAAAIEAWAQA